MQKNTVLGFVLIGLILIGFSWYNSYNYKKQAREAFLKDSCRAIQGGMSRRHGRLMSSPTRTIIISGNAVVLYVPLPICFASMESKLKRTRGALIPLS